MPVQALINEQIGDNKAKKVNGANEVTETPNVCAAKLPATPQGTK